MGVRFQGRPDGRCRQRRLLGLAVGGVFALTACSNSTGSESAETAAPAATAAPATTTAAEPEPAVTEAAPPLTEAASAATEAATAPTEAAPVTEATPAAPEIGEFVPLSGVPGVSDTEIRYAVLSTGPAANALGYCLLECYQAGVQAYFDYYNSLGGVHGRQLVIGRVDDDELGNTQVKILEIVGDDSIFGTLAAPLQYAGFADLGASGMPAYSTFPAAADANGFQNMFLPLGTACGNCPRKLSVATALAAGATKVASLGFGVSQASKDCVANAVETFKKWGPAAGVELVYSNDTLAFGLANGLGPEVTAMKDAGVDGVLLCMDQNSALTLEQELERQGIGDDVTVVLPQGYGDTEFFATNADLLEGDILPVVYRPFEADIAGTESEVMKEWLFKAGGLVNDYNIQGWMGAKLAVTGLLAAGPEFDRGSVVAATNTITDYTASGLHQPVDWSRQHNAPTADDPVTNGFVYDCSVYLIVRGGKLELTGDPSKPFVCLEPGVAEWTEPTPMNFA